MPFMRMMQMPIVKVVDMAIMHDAFVPTIFAMLVFVAWVFVTFIGHYYLL
jgi:hypothetical protein